MLRFAHFNFNVTDLERSLDFYAKALGLEQVRETVHPEGEFRIVFLSDRTSQFQLELTWLRDHPQAYDLGECEFHLAFVTDQYDALHEQHAAMGCICYENPQMGIYFISDPDGYWIEVVPEAR